jgi:hypothetical protein
MNSNETMVQLNNAYVWLFSLTGFYVNAHGFGRILLKGFCINQTLPQNPFPFQFPGNKTSRSLILYLMISVVLFTSTYDHAQSEDSGEA